ncbi:membrane protein [Bacteroidia bacterium]|nr:membrane protein [Bacteroidia bacterium]
MKNNNIIRSIASLAILFSFFSCDNLLETDLPVSIIPQEDIFKDAKNIKMAVNGLYTQNLLSNRLFYYGIPYYLTQITDDAVFAATDYDDLRNNTYTSANTYLAYYWADAYNAILLSNDLITNLEPSTIISEADKQHYIGEAKYFRAYSYFVLTYLYGAVPYITTSNFWETSLQGRDSREVVVGHIIQDLKDVEIALVNSSNENIKVTKLAASALLARTYLYQGEWKNAEDKADYIIRDSTYKLDKNIDDVFLRSSKESIFKTSSSGSWSSYIDRVYYGQQAVNNNFLRLTDDFVNSFEDGDLRKTKWTTTVSGFQHPYKYHRTAASSPGPAEDFVSLRLTEQYFIRAEAAAQQGQQDKLEAAIDDVNVIRERAGLAPLPKTLTKQQVLLSIEQERRHEFFAEEGHRWWDLVRTGRADAVLGAFPGKQWESYKALLPVPQAELNKNKHLEPQNSGYNKVN